jgi:hypothetical protein
MSNKFTKKDIKFIIENHEKLTTKEICDNLKGKEFNQVAEKVVELKRTKKINRSSRMKWKKSEEMLIKKYYTTNKTTLEMVGALKGRTINSVENKIKNMKEAEIIKESKIKTWSQAEVKYLIKNYTSKSSSEIAKALNRTVKQVYSKTQDLKGAGTDLNAGIGDYLSIKEQEKELRNAQKVRMQEIYKNLVEKEKNNRDYGIGDKKLEEKINIGCMYLIKNYSNDKVELLFRGKAIFKTPDHVTFKSPNGVRESFLINDIVRNEIKIERMS